MVHQTRDFEKAEKADSLACMRRTLALLVILLVAASGFAAIYPYDGDGVGMVGEGSAVVKKALLEPFSLQWVETYVDEDFRKDFSALHSQLLSALLPLDDFIMSKEDDGKVLVRRRLDSAVYTFFLSDDGLIVALHV